MKRTPCLQAYTLPLNFTDTLWPNKGSGYGAGMARVWRRSGGECNLECLANLEI
jgi:hypothetical protein